MGVYLVKIVLASCMLSHQSVVLGKLKEKISRGEKGKLFRVEFLKGQVLIASCWDFIVKMGSYIESIIVSPQIYGVCNGLIRHNS